MIKRWLISTKIVAAVLVVVSQEQEKAMPETLATAVGYQTSPIVGSMISVVAASHEMTTRVSALEAKRAAQVALHPTSPYHLNIAGVQNLRPLDRLHSAYSVLR